MINIETRHILTQETLSLVRILKLEIRLIRGDSCFILDHFGIYEGITFLWLYHPHSCSNTMVFLDVFHSDYTVPNLDKILSSNLVKLVNL